jgi:NAD-dependent dihydropyrimidine dehydrogenase PreA subunit
MGEMPIIDLDKCTGCGLCVSICACGALKMDAKIIRAVEVEECGWCTLCELVCPAGAISCPFEIVTEDNQD